MTNIIKVAQQGYDVNTAGDENLIFSSLWPLLKIYKQGPFTIQDVTQGQVIDTHDLGFPPVFMYFSNNTIDAWQNSGAMVQANRSEFMGSLGGGTIGVTNGQIVYNAPTLGATGSAKGYYYIFANDLTTLFNAPVNNVGGLPAGTKSTRAFKIAKTGKNVHSTTLSDFVIHSDTRSPLIQSITPGATTPDGLGNYSLQVQHGLSYVPMFLGYTLSNGQYQNLYTGSGGSSNFTADINNVTFKETAAGRTMSIVVLKDPFLVNYSVSVTQ